MVVSQIFDVLIVALGVVLIVYMTRRFFTFREKQLGAETTLAAEKAAQYAASSTELEQRVRILEQIVTDAGVQTASQIEALRERPALKSGEKAE